MANPLEDILVSARTQDLTVIGVFDKESVEYQSTSVIPKQSWVPSEDNPSVLLFPLCIRIPGQDVIATEVLLGAVLLQSTLYSDIGESQLIATYGSLKDILIKGYHSIMKKDISLKCSLEDDLEHILKDMSRPRSETHLHVTVEEFNRRYDSL